MIHTSGNIIFNIYVENNSDCSVRMIIESSPLMMFSFGPLILKVVPKGWDAIKVCNWSVMVVYFYFSIDESLVSSLSPYIT